MSKDDGILDILLCVLAKCNVCKATRAGNCLKNAIKQHTSKI